MDNTVNNQASQSPEAMPVLESTRPKLDSFGSLYKSSWQFFKANFKSIFIFFFLIGVIPAVLQILFQAISGLALTNINSAALAIILFVVFGLAGFAVNVATQVIYFGAIKKFDDLEGGVREGVFTSYGKILKYTLPVVWVMLISTALFMGGVIALIVPAILFAISSAFIGATVVLEGKRGVDAIVQSFWYVNGRRGAVFGRSLLMLLVVVGYGLLAFIVLASIAIGIAYGVFGGMQEALRAGANFLYTHGGGPNTWPTPTFYLFFLLWSLLSSVIGAILWGFLSTFSFKLWKNVKAITPSAVPEDYRQKTGKTIKIFAWIGVIVIPLVFVSVVLASLNEARERAASTQRSQQMMMDQIRAEFEAQGVKLE
ncbi:MAG TPA: hypothetical protein VEC13_00645 [Candidatus Paceibacterota bacterium]|nr:hypothetical protein [Candidatus Paceibacterota bacterium]